KRVCGADPEWLPRYACGMKSQKKSSVLTLFAFFFLLPVVLPAPGALSAQQAPAPPSPAAPSSSASDELRVAAYTKQEDLKLKVADLKAMTRTTITVHNEHSKADETYIGVRLADLLSKLGAPLG